MPAAIAIRAPRADHVHHGCVALTNRAARDTRDAHVRTRARVRDVRAQLCGPSAGRMGAEAMQAALNVALSAEMRALSVAGGGELVTLSQGIDGDAVNRACVEKWYDLVRCFWEAELWLPTTASIADALFSCDAAYDHRLSNVVTKSARRRWAIFEAEKIHLILSYTARLCRRAAASPSAKVTLLKKLWQRRRSTPSLLEASPRYVIKHRKRP